jgi:lipoate-protein ligase A
MAIDEALLRSIRPDSAPVLRFYTWKKPTLSLGCFQNYKKVVCEPFIVHNKIDVVRRVTGGRSVLHQYEVTYAVVAPQTGVFEGQSLQQTYQRIAQALNLAIRHLGVNESSLSWNSGESRSSLPQCFVTVSKYEISRKTRKIIGSAQKRTRDRFLQHGSILLDFDAELQRGCVNQPDPGIEKKIAPLGRLLGRDLGFAEVTDCFARAFATSFDVELVPGGLTPDEDEAAQLLESTYLSTGWTQNKCR